MSHTGSTGNRSTVCVHPQPKSSSHAVCANAPCGPLPPTAVRLRVAARAWTPGKIQVAHYRGLGKAGLLDLYDRTLPKEANRLLRDYGKQCGIVLVFISVNFHVEPAELGYTVLDGRGHVIGSAATREDAEEYPEANFALMIDQFTRAG